MPKRPRPSLVKKITPPQSSQARLDQLRGLNRKTERIQHHLTANPHDSRSRLVFEKTISQRVEAIANLHAQKPALGQEAHKEKEVGNDDRDQT